MSIAQMPHTRPRPKGRNRPLVEEEPQAKAKAPLKKVMFQGKVKKSWIYGLAVMGVILLVAAVYAFQDQMALSKIDLKIETAKENAFLDREDLLNSMYEGGEGALLGMPMKQVDLAYLENNLQANPTVEAAEVYKSFSGSLKVDVALRKAVGRMVNNSGMHLYVDGHGKKFPISDKHSAYVPLVRGDFEEGIVDTFSCETISDAVPVLTYISENEFWAAQVAEVIIAQNGELTLLPSIGDTEIEFGYPERIEEKFSKLMDFYKQVIPVLGWKAYKSVSLKYKGQVVGRKR